MRQVWTIVAVALAFACGGGESDAASDTAAGAPASGAAAAPAAPSSPEATGGVHVVNMVVTSEGLYEFQPSELTIKAGDTVRWVNVSGGPHNVSFFADRIPTGAEAVLTQAMSGRTLSGPLDGLLLTAPNASYEVVFTNAPVGTYDYTCVPHMALGMNAVLTVE